MSAATDRIMRVYSRFWAIWIADAAWAAAVKEVNRIRYDLSDKVPARASVVDSAKPGDYPAVMLEVDDFTSSFIEQSLTFGGEQGTCGRETRLQLTYTATIASESLKIGQLDLLPVRMVSLISAQPSNLGISLLSGEELPFVEGLGRVTGRVTKTKKGLASGTLRRITTIKIPVNMILD